MIRCALGAVVALFLNNAIAATVNITVFDTEGRPVSDAVVLVRSTQGVPAKPADEHVVIEQKNLRFAPFLSVVSVGSTVRFINRDNYDHHIRSMPTGPLGSTPPAQEFELRLDRVQAPTAVDPVDSYGSTPAAPKRKPGSSSADLKVTQVGGITLGCHLHSSMRGQLYVTDTPWFGKTDANGNVIIKDVPEAAAEVVVWHPDQLTAQKPVKMQLAPGWNSTNAQLNFTPRRKRGS
jgi:plastocyanin